MYILPLFTCITFHIKTTLLIPTFTLFGYNFRKCLMIPSATKSRTMMLILTAPAHRRLTKIGTLLQIHQNSGAFIASQSRKCADLVSGSYANGAMVSVFQFLGDGLEWLQAFITGFQSAGAYSEEKSEIADWRTLLEHLLPDTPWQAQKVKSLSATVLMPTSLLNFNTSLGKSPERCNCRNLRVIFLASLTLSPQPPHRPFSGKFSFLYTEAHLQFSSFPSEQALAIVCTNAAAVSECKKAVSRNTTDVKFFR